MSRAVRLMRSRIGMALVLELLLVVVAAQGPSFAQPAASVPVQPGGDASLRDEIVGLRLRLLKAQARLAELREQRAVLAATALDQSDGPEGDGQHLYDLAVPENLLAIGGGASTKLREQGQKAGHDAQEAENLWKAAMSSKLLLLERRGEVDRGLDPAVAGGDRPASRWTDAGVLALAAL